MVLLQSSSLKRLHFLGNLKTLGILYSQRRLSDMAATGDVIFERKKNAAIITLNRPRSLNALNLSMIESIYPQIQKFDTDADVKVIMMKGVGEKAFCAGGDVRAIAEAGKKGHPLTKTFFKEEYKLNYKIGTLSTPFVALIDGITMGGGVGLSVHGKFRIATEKTLFAMPETAIGFFPDVGGGYFLPRLSGNLGTFLALTGCRLKGRDVYYAGIATHYVQSDLLPEIEDRIGSLDSPDLHTIEKALREYHIQCSSKDDLFSLRSHKETINRIFSAPTVEEIMLKLREDDCEWSQKQLQVMEKMSPLSMCVTLRQLNNGAHLSLADVLQMEYRISQRFMKNPDFYEGIRAVLVHKDNKPLWTPSKVCNVQQEDVDGYFSDLDSGHELIL